MLGRMCERIKSNLNELFACLSKVSMYFSSLNNFFNDIYIMSI